MQASLVRTVTELALRQDGAVTRHQLHRLGVSAKSIATAVRGGWLAPADNGVLVLAATPDTWRRRLRVGLLALDARGWVSHHAAAALYGWPSPAEPVEFTVPRAARGLRAAGVVHTTEVVAPGDVRTVAGLRCSSPTRTLLDLAHAGAPLPHLRACLAAGERAGLTSAAAVAERLADGRGAGHWGTPPLDRLVADGSTGPRRLHPVAA